jgi:hypothetical protein
MMLLSSLLLLINSCRIRNFRGKWSFAPTSWLLMDLLGCGLWVGLWKSSPGSDPPLPSSWLTLLLFLFLQTVQRAEEQAHKTRLPLYPPKKTKKVRLEKAKPRTSSVPPWLNWWSGLDTAPTTDVQRKIICKRFSEKTDKLLLIFVEIVENQTLLGLLLLQIHNTRCTLQLFLSC